VQVFEERVGLAEMLQFGDHLIEPRDIGFSLCGT